MNWKNGFSASYYGYYIDPASWREKERFEITGGTITRSEGGLKDSADIECKSYEQGKERYIRIYLDAWQNGSASHVPLFTGLATSPKQDIDGYFETGTLECYSVLKPAADVLLERGYYVPSGVNGAEVVKDLLSVSPAPIFISGASPGISKSIIAEDGETRLSMAEKVLSVIGWRMRITGNGTIEICPEAATEAAQFDPIDQDVIEPTISVDYDWYSCPNVFRAVQDDLSSVARDDSPDSPLSTVNRGREVWAEETSCDFNTGESISEYALRSLHELQSIAMTAAYDRRYHPDILVGDVVRLRYPVQGLDGLFQITSQRIELGYGAKTSEEVKKI
ncbi:hypothetical protein BHK98_02495 [Hornefia porci]|uniref:Tip attachment protein J domain-containing protein n=1 Tax=Hornefia porci TaxID=2652292 RepID=A0A1Q9JFL9_9FIRM|nr:hypothetical protein [Hornefia porci]OLR55032.1 hypothetical protein BHK98_02495 [Hornefia porci]